MGTITIQRRTALWVVLDGYHVVDRCHTYQQALLAAAAWEVDHA